jgi:hypothetical protein
MQKKKKKKKKKKKALHKLSNVDLLTYYFFFLKLFKKSMFFQSVFYTKCTKVVSSCRSKCNFAGDNVLKNSNPPSLARGPKL